VEDCIQRASIMSGDIYSERGGLLRYTNKIHSFETKLRRGGGSVTPQSGTPGKIDSYVARAHETLPKYRSKGRKSSPVGFRESRGEIASRLDLTAVMDLRG